MQVYKAIKYIRLSYTDDKTVESDSVANQRRLIDDYIARHPEIEVVAEKIDDGYSGVLFDRPAFQEMMRMIEQGEANCVIVKDLSRLGREYIETGRYMRRVFPAYGVTALKPAILLSGYFLFTTPVLFPSVMILTQLISKVIPEGLILLSSILSASVIAGICP